MVMGLCPSVTNYNTVRVNSRNTIRERARAMSAMYAHTCESCGDTGIIIFDENETRIDPCKC